MEGSPSWLFPLLVGHQQYPQNPHILPAFGDVGGDVDTTVSLSPGEPEFTNFSLTPRVPLAIL